ncbi:MAG: hypothetical protein GY859_37885, partial [Desulfobacterales bacterium]|nr:hypothetical protein [Desulfobacterales bacterium]
AFFTALIWLVHPIQTQSVSYIVQRMNSMAAMFYLLSILLYAKGRTAQTRGGAAPGRGVMHPGVFFAGAFCAWMLAMGSKEIAASLPFVVLLYEWFFFQDLDPRRLKRGLPLLVGALALLLFALVMYMGAHPFEKIASGYALREFTLDQRVLTEFRVVIFYISLLIFPHPSRLNLDHDFPLSYSLFDPASTALAIGAVLGLIGLAVHL